MNMLQKLLRHPHNAVFDKSADAVPAFRLQHQDGAAWVVDEGVLAVSTPSISRKYRLADHTIGSLILRLKVDGFTVVSVSTYLFGRSARVLVPGSGSQAQSNGDQLMGFRSLLWAIYSAFAPELVEAKRQVGEALKQMVITTAEGEWLDLWGNLYSVPREDGEKDGDYQRRIPEEAFRLRVNKIAIEQAVFDLTGKRIVLLETWRNMFRLDESVLSGSDRLVDSDRWRYGYIQPVAKELIDWTEVLKVIDRNRAAGVIILPPQSEISDFVDGRVDGTIAFGMLARFGALVRTLDEARLDWMQLGNTHQIRNWGVRIDAEWAWVILGGVAGEVSLGAMEEFMGWFISAAAPEQQSAGIGSETGGTVNFNRWTRNRTWSRETWGARGAPVPRRAGVRMDTETS
ncbi:hypothetical protein K32_49430 [Kaistia sp. 32K]|uniref:hypothetical protein n=1 Tax=Kaistia sp. 32K TaxID=2795690 RepID=UPI0019157DB4|nr:hypothetical protein [Kaistia sp. 32K]BCP56326.1 hypothetical protein K32_49430 [Kaistia sp. 32K]